MGKLAIDRGERDGLTVLVLSGDLDIAGADALDEELLQVESSARSGVLALDLREISFLDSSGLRVLLAADARARGDGRRLVLVRGSAVVHRVFEIALLDRRLTFVDDLDAMEREGP